MKKLILFFYAMVPLAHAYTPSADPINEIEKDGKIAYTQMKSYRNPAGDIIRLYTIAKKNRAGEYIAETVLDKAGVAKVISIENGQEAVAVYRALAMNYVERQYRALAKEYGNERASARALAG